MTMQAGQNVWLTKYALSDGITEQVVKSFYESGYVTLDGHQWNSYKVGSDVHASYEEAVAAAKAQREKRIASLKKQIAKLEKLAF